MSNIARSSKMTLHTGPSPTWMIYYPIPCQVEGCDRLLHRPYLHQGHIMAVRHILRAHLDNRYSSYSQTFSYSNCFLLNGVARDSIVLHANIQSISLQQHNEWASWRFDQPKNTSNPSKESTICAWKQFGKFKVSNNICSVNILDNYRRAVLLVL